MRKFQGRWQRTLCACKVGEFSPDANRSGTRRRHGWHRARAQRVRRCTRPRCLVLRRDRIHPPARSRRRSCPGRRCRAGIAHSRLWRPCRLMANRPARQACLLKHARQAAQPPFPAVSVPQSFPYQSQIGVSSKIHRNSSKSQQRLLIYQH